MRSLTKTAGKFLALFILSVITISSFSFLPINIGTLHAQAVDTKLYTPLSPLPYTTTDANCTGTDCKSTIETYVPGIFKIIIGLAAVVAVGRIIWGGILYITTDAWSTKSEGKEMIKKSIYGLLFITASWLIFYTINPKLFDNNRNLSISIAIKGDMVKGGLPSGVDPVTLATINSALTRVATSCPGCVVNGTNLNLSASDVARLSCTTCAPLNRAIAIGANSQPNVVPSLNARLTALNQAMPITVTEAYPPTVHHTASCHYDGTCVDVTIANPTVANIRNFIDTANGSSINLRAVYEGNCAVRDTLRSQGYTAYCSSDPGFGHITGTHFSIYPK